MAGIAKGYEVSQGKVKISISPDCNLNCRYCSKEGTIGIGCKRTISTQDLLLLCEALFNKGYRHAYLGGGGYGEPLLAKDIHGVIKGVKDIGYEKITLVTNGVLLKKQCEKLFSLGVTGCNISLDTLDERIYTWLCGKDLLRDVIEGIKEASKIFHRTKVTTVLLEGINDIEMPSIMYFCSDLGVELQLNDLVNLVPGDPFYEAHYKDPSYLLEELNRNSYKVEIIKRDSKHKYYMDMLTITVRLTKAYTNIAIREDSPIIRPDGKVVWLSHENIIFDMAAYRRTHRKIIKKEFFQELSESIDNRLKGITSQTLKQIAICGSFSRASW
ncbi:MAG: radical SAM protein [Thermodesulfovibrionales bacterium]|jgi:molybdenum cofactor biosynthesis enzyme MoaA|nr:radical SAM protein [Thermodesulfovibrionales bacterium]